MDILGKYPGRQNSQCKHRTGGIKHMRKEWSELGERVREEMGGRMGFKGQGLVAS